MSQKTFSLSPSMKLVRQTSEGRTVELPPSDVPIEFDVRAEDGVLTFGFVYQQGMDEPRSSSRMGQADCEVGVYSQRLFSIRMRFDRERKEKLQQFGEDLRHALLRALRMLRERTVTEGARMNYRIVEAGLVGEDSMRDHETTPAWMHFALERMRSDGPSSGSGRSR